MAGITTRLLPVGITGGVNTGYAGGPNPADPSRRYYTAGPGQTVDAAGPPDADAAMLVSQGFAIVALSGTTALRNSLVPNSVIKGTLWCDLTLGRVIMYDGVVWRDVMNGNAV
jgi:hypothetical protein